MSLGRQRERQADMLVSWAEMPRSPRHVFYDKLQAVLIAADFDAFVETQCAKDYAGADHAFTVDDLATATTSRVTTCRGRFIIRALALRPEPRAQPDNAT
jgi:hypothetical protein